MPKSARRDRGGRFFRSYSRNRGSGRIFFGRETTWRNESSSGATIKGGSEPASTAQRGEYIFAKIPMRRVR